ncbi:MAG: hypothetical protein GY847_23745 [Proteobacteria bacterium]|nr:hypothetical protein [Pseudomonadota bacterium]
MIDQIIRTDRIRSIRRPGLIAMLAIAVICCLQVSTNEAQADDSEMTALDAEDGCRPVRGIFVSESVLPPECQSPVGLCTKGKLYGSLWGDYEMTANQLLPTGEPAVPYVNFFTGTSTVNTLRGKTIIGVDTGSMNGLPPGTPGSGEFSTLLTFVEGGFGYLHIKGKIDFITGKTRGKFSGMLCEE